MSYVQNLKCVKCRAVYELEATARCSVCQSPLDPSYDIEGLKTNFDRDSLQQREKNIWRYLELLPLSEQPSIGHNTGWTPLIESPTLASKLGVGKLWVKCDSHCYPSLSFKDRVVAVAINRALELGLSTVGCPSTGNLANSVAALAAEAGIEAYVFIPADIELGKTIGSAVYNAKLVRVRGSYDEINVLMNDVADKFGWGIVNVNLRPYYGEGSKTMAFEIAEQLGWRAPTAVVTCMAGGLLITKLAQGFEILGDLGFITDHPPRMYGVQADGCNPIASAISSGANAIVSQQPDTIARSIAIGNPVDGMRAVETIRCSGGTAVSVSDSALLHGIKTLAGLTGIFTETAGGVTTAGALSLGADRVLASDDEVVLCITGNGMKTVEALEGTLDSIATIEPGIDELEALL